MTVSIVLASRNPRKLAELQPLLAPLRVKLRLVSDFTDEAPEETGETFQANALIKARDAARVSGLPAIADDSGIEVEALRGLPGVRSARFAGESAGDADNNGKLLGMLREVPDERRAARFVCAMVYVRAARDPEPILVQAHWAGRILREPRGANGFGYDPLFHVPDHDCSAAELPPDVKNRISHRGQAAARLVAKLAGLVSSPSKGEG